MLTLTFLIPQPFMRLLYSGFFFSLFCLFFTLWGQAQNTYSFTTAGATGRQGPTQAQVNAAYPAGHTLHGQVTINTQGIQEWTVPATGMYRITAAGAAGGGANSLGGRGRIIQGEIELTAGEKLKILVGQMGGNGGGPHGNENGGGGGSFVVRQAGNTPVIVAGGGGGAPSAAYGTSCVRNPSDGDGKTTTAGTTVGCSGSGFPFAAGGINGNGGSSIGAYQGGAGGGFYTNGATGEAHCAPAFGGLSFLNGGVGGTGNTCYGVQNEGGFGGGGGGQLGGPGGGGGYSGGGATGSWASYSTWGGGGGSYTHASMTNILDGGFNLNHGFVTIATVFYGGVVAANQSICGSGTPALFSSTAPASGPPISGYQWESSTNNATWTAIINATSLTYQASVVNQTTYYRRKATATNGTVAYSNTITVTVNPSPTVNDPADLVVCAGVTTEAINFSGTASNYTWTNSNTATGLTASGMGDIAAFTATNSTSSPITSTVTVTPVNSAELAYIPNGGTLSIFNLQTNTEVGSINLNSGSFGIAISPDGNTAYLTDQGSPGKVTVVNTATNSITTTITVGSVPYGIAISADGSKVYVANNGSQTLSVINTSTNTVVATVPVGNDPIGVAVSPDGSKVFVANRAGNTVSVIDAATNTVTGSLSAMGPFGIVVSPDNSKVYITNQFGGQVSVYNALTNALITTIPTGSEPRGIAISPNGSRLYVANRLSNTTTIINTATNTVVATLSTGNEPFGVSVSGDGSKAYVANFLSRTVSVINTATNTVTATLTVGNLPVAFGSFIKKPSNCAGTPQTFTITVNPAPAVTSAATASVCSGVAQNYTITSGVAGTTFTWSRAAVAGISNAAATGSGATITESLTNTTSAPLNVVYQITPTANGCAGSVFTYTVTVNPRPAGSTVVTNVACFGGSTGAINLTPSGGTAPYTFLWNNGATTEDRTGLTAGTYSVTLTDANGCSGTVSNIQVTDGTPVTMNAVASQTVCAGSATTAVTFSGTASTYSWTNSNASIGLAASGTSNITSFTAVNSGTTPQTATITVTPSTGSCTGTPQTFTIKVNPAPTVTSAATGTICSGVAQNYTITSGVAGTTFTWSRAAVAGISNAGVSGQTTNTITETLINTTNAPVEVAYTITPVANSCAGTAFTYTVTVNPVTTISTQPTPQLVCPGSPAAFNVIATGTNLTYQWRRDGIDIPGATSSSHHILTPTIADEADYDVVITGSCGTVTSDAASLIMYGTPAIATQPASQTVCTGTNVTFSITAPAGVSTTGLTYQWRKGGVNIIGANSNVYTISNANTSHAGDYDLVISSPCGTSLTSNPATLTVNAPAAITTQPTAVAVCSGESATFTVGATGAGLTYQWRKGGTNITNATAATYTISNATLADAASYDVVVTGTCGNATSAAAVLEIKPLTAITTQPTAQVVCEGASATFSVAATGSGTLTYQWKKDGSPIAAATSATYSITSATAAHAGTYTVDVTAGCGTVTSTGAVLTVNPLPAAAISGTATVCQSASAPLVTFTGSHGTAPYTFTYTINGGANQTVTTTSGNAATVSAPTGTAGTYIYELVGVKDASSTACTNAASGSATVTVTAMATASLSYTGTPYCATGTATPTFTGTTGGTYSSTAGLSLNATTGVIDLAASTPGTYTVTYTIAAAGGCAQVTATASITINALTVINTQPVAQTVCAGTAVTFSVNASGTSLTYQWRKGGVNIAGATNSTYSIASTNVADDDTYDVIVSSSCGMITSDAVKLTINTPPSITTQPSGQVLCAGATASFSVAATGTGLTYQWQKDGADIAGANGSAYTINAIGATHAGSYTVVITGTCGTLTSTAANLIVNATTAITSQPTANVVCEGASATFSIAASGTALTYQWRKGGVAINGATAATYTINNPTAIDAGTYDVVVTGACGVVTSTAATLTVNAIPATPTIAAGSATTFCQGESVTLTSSATSGNQWFKDGVAITGATGRTYVATVSGSYTVQSTVSNCPSAVSAAVPVTVKPLPATPVISATGNILTSSVATGNQWFLNGVAINGATGATHRVQASGLYTVQVTQNGCSVLSAAYNFVATAVGTPDNWNGEVITYPNPVFQTLYVKNNTGHKLQVQLFDGLGRKVYENQFAGTEGHIPVTGLANGTYRLVITDLVRKETISQSIIKL